MRVHISTMKIVPTEVDRFGKTVHVYDVGVASFLCD